MIQKTFALLKPDCVRRNLIGEIISRIEKKGLKITKMKIETLSIDTAKQHYVEHKDKSFFNNLIEFITNGPVVCMEIEGENAVSNLRGLATTIRSDYSYSVTANIIHTTDYPENVQRELNLHFGE